MDIVFKKATKKAAKARIAISGPAGSGKTYTALKLATAMCKRVAVIDTEFGSASKYADEFDFDVVELDDFHPDNYIKAIKAAEAAGYDGLIIDSITHEWSGKNGCLELVELFARRNKGGNKFAAWADVTPLHNAFIETIHSSKMHIIATMRSKMDYIQTENEKGKTVIQKVGMAPITREGVEYEFDIFGEMDLEHNMIITKSRCKALADRVIPKPGEELAKEILAWLSDGVPEEEPESISVSQQEQKATVIRSSANAAQKSILTDKQIKRFYAIVHASGAGNDVAILCIQKVAPDVVQNGKINWEAVDRKTYDQLCEMFESGEWQTVFESVEQSNEINADYDDLDMEELEKFLNEQSM